MGVAGRVTVGIAIPVILCLGSTSAQLIVGLTVGNLNGIPIYADTGQIISVPIYAYANDTIYMLHIPVATDNNFIVERMGGNLHFPLEFWDDCSILTPNPDSARPNFTNQSILGFCDLTEPPSPRLFTDGAWLHIADFSMRTGSSTEIIGDTSLFSEGWSEANGGILFGGVEPGVIPVEQIELHWGALVIHAPNIDGIPGDVNNSHDVNGLDAVWLSVNYLKGYGPPPLPLLRGDTNGDCSVNGLDVVYIVNYLKGIGSAPFWGNCP